MPLKDSKAGLGGPLAEGQNLRAGCLDGHGTEGWFPKPARNNGEAGNTAGPGPAASAP